MYIEVHTIEGPNGGINGMDVSDETAKLLAGALAVGLEGAPASGAAHAEALRVLELLQRA